MTVRPDMNQGVARVPEAPELLLEQLMLADLPQVLALHQSVLASAQHGHLAERAEGELRAVLSDPEASASVGAWACDGAGRKRSLAAYTLCGLEQGTVYPNSPTIVRLQATGAKLWTGKGTVVAPAYEGRLLMPKLLRARGDILRARRSWNTAGLIAVDNLASLAGALRAGGWIVGLERDAYCLNFVCYAGALSAPGVGEEREEALIEDTETIDQFIQQGWVGVGLGRCKSRGRRLLLFARPSGAMGD